MNNKTLPYWLAVEESKTVRFSELAHLMAKAMHPGDDELTSYAAARINLETELKQAVEDGALTVRNASGLGPHTFAHGDALQRAVLIPSLDLGPFLNARGIELRLTPHGSGPDYWTLENAAAAIAEQEQWHDGARGSLENALLEAASSRALVVRHPHTDLPKTDGDVRAFYELVTPSDVNAWLEKQGAPYRWSVARPEMKPEPQAATPAPVVAGSADDGEAWKAKARERADEIIKRQRAKDLHPSQEDIADEIAREFRADGVMGAGGKPLTGAYIKRHALKGISSAQNRQLSTSIRRGK